MAHEIYKLGNEFLAARRTGTDASWHKLEGEAETLGSMWNATQGRVAVRKLPAFVEWGGAQHQLPSFALAACFDTGHIELASNVGSEGYQIQDLEKVYDLVSAIDAVHPCDYIAVLSSGFQTTFSFNIGDFKTADGQEHFSRFLFSTRNDRTGADIFNLSNIRVVCKNTFASALSEGVTRRFRHATGIDAKVAAVANPLIEARLDAARAAQADYIGFYNDLLALPEPNRDLFFSSVFGEMPENGKAKAQWVTKRDNFMVAHNLTLTETPELEGTAALWFNAATRSQQMRRTRGGEAAAINGGMAISGQNSEVVDLATAFFEQAIRQTTKPLPAPMF